MNENLNHYHQRETTCTFIYIREKKGKRFYIDKKDDNFNNVFIYKKSYTLRYAIFMEFLTLRFYIQKV